MRTKLFLFGFVLILLSSFAMGSLTDGNVAYWSFDKTNYNSSIFGGITGSEGKIDGTGNFDGTDDYILGGDIDLEEDTEFSVFTWYNSEDTSNQRFLHKQDDDSPYTGWYLESDGTGTPYVKVGIYDGTSLRDVTNETDVLDGDWHLIGFVNNGTSVTLWIDGINSGSETQALNTILNNDEIRMGGRGPDYWEGYLDEVSIFNRSLSESEITQLYNSGNGIRADTIPTGLIYYNSMDGLYDLSDNGNNVAGYNGVIQVDNQAGLLQSAMYFDRTDDYLATTHQYSANQTFTWNAWFKSKDSIFGNPTAEFGDILSLWGNSAAVFRIGGYATPSANNGKILFETQGAGGGSFTTTGTYNDNNWHMVTAVFNGTTMFVYIDNINLNNFTTATISNYTEPFTIGARKRAGFGAEEPYNGYIDEVSIFNRSLSESEITELYNSGTGYNPYSTTSGAVVISATYPETNNQFSDSTININATINASSINSTFNCSLYLNGALNYTWTNQANTTTLIEVGFTFASDTNNTYYFNCTDGITETLSTEKYFYVDFENPEITSVFTNNSVFSNYNNLTGQFNFSDGFMLYSYNVSIDGATISNSSNLGVTEYVYNLSYDVTGLSPGIHTLSVRIADGHTAKAIPTYSVNDGLFNNYLEYTFPDNNYIKIEGLGSSIFDKFTTEKQKDRYSFEYTPSEKLKSSYTFMVTSSQELNVIETDNKYKNYLISGNQWLDFVSPDNLDSTVEIKLNSPYEAEVTVSGLKTSDKFNFNSIGELNIVEQNFTFITVNASVTYESPVVETQSHTTSLTFDFTGTGLNENNFSANLIYNGTSGTLLTTTDSTTYVTYTSTLTAPSVDEISTALFNWSVNATTTPISINYNHTIYEINIDNCANHVGDGNWTEALNFLSLDEEGNATEYVTNTTLNIDFSVWLEDEDVYQNFSFGFTGGYNYSVCIYPNSSTYLVNAVSEYYAPNMANRKYYLDNYQLNATPNTIYLYNLNSSKASDITIRVYDKNTAENIEGAFVKILRYYPESGSYKTVEIEKTDANGYTLGKMVLADVFYKFIVETDRTVRLDTSVERIISLTKNLGIIEGSDLLESWRKINDVNTFVGCNNLTKKCTFTWSDDQNLVQTATLKVYRFGGYGRTLINEQSASSVAGTLTYTITEDTDGNTYTAMGFIETNTANSFYTVGEAYLEYLTDMHDKFGVSGVFPIMLLILAIGAAFLETGAVGVIAGSLIGLIIMALTGFVGFGFGTIVTFIIIGGILIAKLRA